MTVKIIKPEDTFEIRKKVLRENIPLPYEFPGDFDESTTHFGFFIENKLVSVATVLKSSNQLFSGNQYQLRGMATLSAYQGKGYGSVLLQSIIEFLKDKKAEILWFNARIIALNFYQKLGFQTIGELFELQYVGEHYIMFKKFKN
ncbi:MAG: GNAT family N-acetyltransferase [Flavobacteriaceae bacterium]|nr:GNAT family N-acetyltransferase [Flavobacteriaceae bacterium]